MICKALVYAARSPVREFPVAAVTNDRQWGDLKQQKSILPQLWKSEA